MNSESENVYECQYCHLTFDSSEELEDHVLSIHYREVEQNLSKIKTIAEEHKETIQEWKDQKKKELLLKIARDNPRLLHEIQVSPHSDEMLDKEVEMELFKRALHTNSLDSFSAMWIRHPKFEEIYKASREKPEHQPQTGDSTGQSEEFFESPDKMIDSTEGTNTRENLSNEDKKKLELIKVLFALTRRQK